jgi:(1->4)-alpha-D-glucan 1-alpha-D-glucosylmutase
VPPAVPLSTYRLQFRKDFGFEDAARIVPYLQALGVTHLYASPFLKARPGSTHGYDVVDFNALNPEFGGDEGFARLTAALKAADLGLILDFVPNHMAVGSDNAWWLDVLEWGPKSRHAVSFDISWDLLPYRPGGGVLLPVLGQPYGDALTKGEIALKYDAREGSFSAWYFDQRFPINPQRYADIVKTIVLAAKAADQPAGRALLAAAADYAGFGSPSYAEAPALKVRLSLIEGAAAVIDRGLVAYRADHETGLGALHRLLERQHYRLADWHLAVAGINYRRFFDINELAGLRVEDSRTFREMHKLVARLIATGQLQGLRLDHIDGLLDPQQYTRRLQQLIREARGEERRQPFYVVVEKILADGEDMPALPGVAGATGYEWLNVISRVLVDAAGQRQLAALWRDIDPPHGDFRRVAERAKLRVLETIMASEFAVLVQLLIRIAAGHFTTRDYSADRLREALRSFVLEFPVYRTYLTAQATSDTDRAIIEQTIARARRRWQGTDSKIFDFLRDALTLDLIRDRQPYSRPRVRKFALKMQQFTGPMTAKSLEDTAFYRYHALLALNEVGGEPTLPGLSVAEFHERMKRRATHFRDGLTATATHDTKRGEDARARLLALSEIPALWAEHVAKWQSINARLIKHDGRRLPSCGHEYMLYQALVGAWPREPIDDDFIRRIEDYAIKAAREGKLETSWLNPDEDYERGLRDYVRAILNRETSGLFLESFALLAQRAALLGALNSVAQLVLKTTMPGVPDFYQGTEFWDLSLVDPDNRRPVDFSLRQSELQKLGAAPNWPDLANQWPDGRIKLALVRQLLALRKSLAALFHHGRYEPIDVVGPDREHVIAFIRRLGRARVIVIVARHWSRKTDGGRRWPRGDWHAELKLDADARAGLCDALGSCAAGWRQLEMSRLLATLPVAVLWCE